jgi:hypothetical protein
MIYIEEKLFERQVDLLEYFRSKGDFDLIIWFSPESKLRNICKLKLAPKDLIEGEQVSSYGDYQPRKTRRIELSSNLLKEIRHSAKEILSNCDSLALYRPTEKNWAVCTIEHEGMCLASDENLIDELVSEGFTEKTRMVVGYNMRLHKGSLVPRDL